jgi:hypothetical protein
VPQGNLSRANCLSNAYGRQSKEGARLIHKIKPISLTEMGFLLYVKDKEILIVVESFHNKIVLFF